MSRNNLKNTKSDALSEVIEVTKTEERQAQPTAITKSAGVMLRDARVAKKLSIEDISKYLRISVKQIQAIEDENFVALPEPVIVKGFLRNYARMLDINPDPILDAYKLNMPELMQPFTLHKSINQPITNKNKRSWVSYVVASVLVIFALGIWVFYDYMMSNSNKLGSVITSLAPNSAVIVSPVTEPLPEIALPAAERASQKEQNQKANPSNAGANANSSVDVPIIKAPASPLDPEVGLATEISTSDAGIPTTKLNFSAREETWVNLSDANGKVIYNKILAAGTQQSIQVQAVLPIKVIVGNISGTTFFFNGNPVDLASYAKLNVAKFSLK